LDSDDLLLPIKFEVQVKALREHPECGVAYGYTRLIDDGDNVLEDPYKWTGRKIEYLFPLLLIDRWWNTHTPLYKREVCDAVGPWKNMSMGEDWEYDARVGALRTKLVHCETHVSHHRKHHDSSRLTGGGLNADKMRDFGILIESLYSSAMHLQLDKASSEMQHFCRWAFLVSRQAGALGLSETSRKCFAVAKAVSSQESNSSSLKIYRALVAVLGWSFAGKLSCFVDTVLRRKPSSATQKLSWQK
jgi:hypothetical protein